MKRQRTESKAIKRIGMAFFKIEIKRRLTGSNAVLIALNAKLAF